MRCSCMPVIRICVRLRWAFRADRLGLQHAAGAEAGHTANSCETFRGLYERVILPHSPGLSDEGCHLCRTGCYDVLPGSRLGLASTRNLWRQVLAHD